MCIDEAFQTAEVTREQSLSKQPNGMAWLLFHMHIEVEC